MYKKLSILLFAIAFCSGLFAQVKSEKDTLDLKSHHFPEEVQIDNNLIELDRELNTKSSLSEEELTYRATFVKYLIFKTPEFYNGPPTERQEGLGRILPHTNDYAYFTSSYLGDNFTLNTAATHATYMTIGAISMVNANVSYHFDDNIIVSGGIYSAKYTLPHPSSIGGFQHYNDIGFDGSLRVKLSDKFYIRGHGRYSLNSGDRDRFIPASAQGLFPTTYYGGGLEYKVNDKFGVEGGMVRELNPMTGKWVNRPYVMPIFYSIGRR